MRPPTARRLRASSSAERSARSSPRVSPTWSGRRARRSRCRPSWRSSRETRSCSTGSPSARPAGPAMSNAEIQRLFAPRPATVAAVRSYLSANGLSVVDSTDMSLVVSGTAAAADQAFGVGLQDIHRRARDHVSGAVEERPAAQGDRLGRAVGGGARFVAQAAPALPGREARARDGRRRQGRHRAATPSPDAPRREQADERRRGLPAAATSQPDGLQPRRAGQRQERRYGADRSGSSSSRTTTRPTRSTSRTASRASRAGLGTDATIGGGPSDHFGQVEVNLDLEVAMGAAPDAGLKVYKAANNLALLPTMLAPDAHRRRRRRLGQLGPLRAVRPGQADRGREHRARAARGEQRVVLRRLGRRRRRPTAARPTRARSSSRSTIRRASRSRRPSAGRICRRRRSGPRREGVEGLGRRHLDQLAQAGLPARRRARPTCRADSARAARPSAA